MNLSFLVDFFTGLGKKKLLIVLATAAAVILLSVILIIGLNKNPDKNAAEDSDKNETENPSEDELYSPALDDGAWVESLLAQIEEERIAEELRAMEESLEEYQMEEDDEFSEFDESDESEEDESEEDEESGESSENAAPAEPVKVSEVERFFSEEKHETVKLGKSDGLKYFEFENEIFSPQDTEGNHILIHAVKEKVSRFFYNDEYKLVKKETWKIPSALQYALEKTETYEYFNGTKVLSAKKIIEKNSIENIKYNSDGKVTSVEKYAVADEKQYITSERKFSYNDEGKLLTDLLKEYFYKASDYKVLDYSFTKKYIYTYNEGDIPPDFKYYENDVLKMYNKYSSEKGTYTSRIYFDEGLSVKAYYENDVRVRDVYYRNNNVIREKVYERSEQSEE